MINIAIVDDDPISTQIVLKFLRSVFACDVMTYGTAEDFLKALPNAAPFDVVLLDIILPGMDGITVLKRLPELMSEPPPVIMLSGQEKIDTAVEALRNGAKDYMTKPFDLVRLEQAVRTIIEVNSLRAEVKELRHQITKEIYSSEIIASSSEMREVFNFITKVKDANVPVLILGESGTGKELVAQAIHHYGNRSKQPFIAVNCAAIPNDLLESELFGHERGAFTGAVERKEGKFELANGGTLFLDEVAEMDTAMQSKLLRVLQSKQLERVGGKEPVPVDVRIISATNANIGDATASKRFRPDLYYRLSTFPIVLPPLRKRKSDIVLLADHFLRKYAAEYGKEGTVFDKEVIRVFGEYNWPGNVRELENIIQRAILMSEGKRIRTADIPNLSPVPLSHLESLEPAFDALSEIPTMEQMNELLVRHALKREQGNISTAAKTLKIGRATLYRMIKRFGSKAG
ncbi:MAG: sigma-54-dependent Fis family transcriptional regulator [Bacteroidetes bacterium]|nr:sigma-54-dependent Fis family transcriptional regulator [Bacteroidota bacterium]